jgi:hypothetical protein
VSLVRAPGVLTEPFALFVVCCLQRALKVVFREELSGKSEHARAVGIALPVSPRPQQPAPRWHPEAT